MSTGLGNHCEIFRESGATYLSPARVGKVMELDLGVLADALGVDRNTIRLHPQNQRIQDRLLQFNKVFLALLHVQQDPVKAAFHLKSTPIRVLGQRTLLEAVKDGDEDKALRYLHTISDGQNG